MCFIVFCLWQLKLQKYTCCNFRALRMTYRTKDCRYCKWFATWWPLSCTAVYDDVCQGSFPLLQHLTVHISYFYAYPALSAVQWDPNCLWAKFVNGVSKQFNDSSLSLNLGNTKSIVFDSRPCLENRATSSSDYLVSILDLNTMDTMGCKQD